MQHRGDAPASPAVSYRRSIDISTDAFLDAMRLAGSADALGGEQPQPVDVIQIAWGLVGRRIARGSATHRTGPPKGVSRYAVAQKGRQLALRHAVDTVDEDLWIESTSGAESEGPPTS